MVFYQNKKGLTLLEMLIVLSTISVLFALFFYFWKSSEFYSRARDSKRLNDLALIDSTLKTLILSNSDINLGNENLIYISLPDSDPNCSSYNLPKILPPYSYRCTSSSTLNKTNGTGWIPVDFDKTKIVMLSSLPVDPLNNKDYFYSYQVKNGKFKLTAKLESLSNISKMVNDGGFEPTLYEIGSDITFPSPQSSLIAYLNFDEGTGTIAYDYSGYKNNGNLINGPTWTNGKISKALSFDGIDDYVSTNISDSLNDSALHYTVIVWFKANQQNEYWKGIVGKPGRNYNIWLGGANTNSPFIHHRFHTNVSWNDGCPDLAGIIWNDWNFVAITNDGITCHTYIFNNKGSFHTQRTFNATLISDNTPFTIAKNLDGGNGNYFNGIIDEIRIYNRALTKEEIEAIYEQTK